MAIFTREFANLDEYEQWLAAVSGRVTVLSIDNSPILFGSTTKTEPGPVTLKYQTRDRSLFPPKSLTQQSIEVALVAAAFFLFFLYLIFRI
jgi:hypothetical protein